MNDDASGCRFVAAMMLLILALVFWGFVAYAAFHFLRKWW